MAADNANGSWTEDLQALQQQIKELSREKQNCSEELHRLRSKEDPDSGLVFAQEIHKLQIQKLQLEIELDFRRKKMNRIMYELGQ